MLSECNVGFFVCLFEGVLVLQTKRFYKNPGFTFFDDVKQHGALK